jgi:hypothetical protein
LEREKSGVGDCFLISTFCFPFSASSFAQFFSAGLNRFFPNVSIALRDLRFVAS